MTNTSSDDPVPFECEVCGIYVFAELKHEQLSRTCPECAQICLEGGRLSDHEKEQERLRWEVVDPDDPDPDARGES
jgi:hypothetical protein